jgi:hypothetical protein
MAGDEGKKSGKKGRPREESPAPAREDANAERSTEADSDKKDKETKKKKKKGSWIGAGTNAVTMIILGYGMMVANTFRSILYPKFPDIDPRTNTYMTKYGNTFKKGDECHVKLWVSPREFPREPPLAEFDFRYDFDEFKPFSNKFNTSISKDQLRKGNTVHLSSEVLHKETGTTIRAKGSVVKKMKTPEVRPKYHLLKNELCPEDEEPSWGKKKTHIGRGLPKMQVRMVMDDTFYPAGMLQGPYLPKMFVDEFWLTDDQLVKLNSSGESKWESEAHFGLMSAARWRFQTHMERSFAQNAKLFGEDSEEMLQMRDLVANTNPTLLATTFVVSFLHLIFEFLAFKNDVIFWQSCDADALNKFVSVHSIVANIVMQLLLLLYLWDESANILVLITTVATVAVDCWKVQRAMKVVWTKLFGFLPVPMLASKAKREKTDNFDSQAMKWLALLLSPGIVGYGIYTMMFDCHRSWYSLFLNFTASCVYSLGFVLMTPQVFINYKHKSVAYLPWRKFIYRALNTFIDDLFAFIIRMPTMHRLSVFRDDIVFIVYLFQRWHYPADMSREFDEDGYMIQEEEKESSEDKKQK